MSVIVTSELIPFCPFKDSFVSLANGLGYTKLSNLVLLEESTNTGGSISSLSPLRLEHVYFVLSGS